MTKCSFVLASALLVCACGTDEPSSGTASDGGGATGGSGGGAGSGGSAGTSGSGGAQEPGITKLPAGWNSIKPGGATTCSRGTPFQYFVRKGTVNRVVIDFRGGGACWNAFTCSVAGAIFEETAEADDFILDESLAEGIYAHDNPENPFKDWHHVYIPYCTGDVHWGDAERTYQNGDQTFTIRHKGGVNARAVLDWVYTNVPSPEKVFVTGCSAGAYGAIMWSAHIRNHYGSTKVFQFADSGAGVITDTFFQESFPQWNAEASYPKFIPNVDPADFTRLPQLYTLIGTTYPDMFVSQYNTNYDDNQHFYYNVMGGGDAYEWSQKMRAHVTEIENSTPNFSSYIAPGSQHCIIPYENFYTMESNGVRLVNWLNDVVTDKVVESAQCDPNCGNPLPK